MVEPRFVKISDGRNPNENGSRWYILPTVALRNLIIKRRYNLESRCRTYNYALTWRDVQGYGLELAHADWVPEHGLFMQ